MPGPGKKVEPTEKTLDALKEKIATQENLASTSDIVILYDDQLVDSDTKYQTLLSASNVNLDKCFYQIDTPDSEKTYPDITLQKLSMSLSPEQNDNYTLSLLSTINRLKQADGTFAAQNGIDYCLHVSIPKKDQHESNLSYKHRIRDTVNSRLNIEIDSNIIKTSQLDWLLRASYKYSNTGCEFTSGIPEREVQLIFNALLWPPNELFLPADKIKTIVEETKPPKKPKNTKTPAGLSITAFTLTTGAIASSVYFGVVWAGVISNASISIPTAEIIMIASLIALAIFAAAGSLTAHYWRKNSLFNKKINSQPGASAKVHPEQQTRVMSI